MSRRNLTNLEAQRSFGKRPFGLWIGLLAPLKSPLEVADIARMTPEMDFVMVGWSYDKSIADRLRMEKPANLYYVGPVANDVKRELIQKCCVGLTTSKYEGFGLTPSEFLYAGKPVLAYPLDVFREVYGDLVIYANTIDDFVKQLRHICSRPSYVAVDIEVVARRLAKYDLTAASSRILQRLGTRSLLVFTQDVPMNRKDIAGYYLLQWRLWELMRENEAELKIFANGQKYSREFHLADSTIQVGSLVEYLRCHMEARDYSPRFLDRVERKILDLSIRILEPLSYVHRYTARRRDIPSTVIIATGCGQILGGIIVKYLFGLKLVCLVHDMRLNRYEWARSSFPMKIYNLAYTHALLHADLIMLVSDTMRREFLNYYPYHDDRLMVIWNDDAPRPNWDKKPNCQECNRS